jgi:hypothetical protein
VQRRHQDGLGTAPLQGRDGGNRVLQRRNRAARQKLQLELVRRRDIRGRQREVTHEFGNSRPHIDAAPDIADHRIAAVTCARVGGPHLRHRIEDRRAGAGRTHIAGQHAVALTEHAARRNAAHQLGDQLRLEHTAGPFAVTGVIGELHRVDRPYLDPDALQRKDRGAIADMAVGDMRLDREEIHAQQTSS